ncbi:PolC-type DNA polymerase III [Symbiobacterium thermophilum]|uniref:DNA polymerase III PolC-type n=5 Tax=Symbiobacterium thermophilum TaxID=2734 RepID=Q67P96_SYMTH|nr:PolC-type DNA polymerase III [Symbiobacterium thermophilum]BAD40497.1 DNA polymerase III alpha subunit [Symbiobacterium thermophilum IAM 14863]
MSPQSDWLSLIDVAGLPPQVQSFLAGARPVRVVVNRRRRTVALHLASPVRLPLDDRPTLARAVAEQCLGGLAASVTVVPVRDPDPQADASERVGEAWPEVLLQLKQALPLVNGLLDRAEWRVEAATLVVELPTAAQAEVVEHRGVVPVLERLIRQETGCSLQVRVTARPVPRAERVEPPTTVPDDPFADAEEEVPLPPEPIPEEPAFADEYFEQWMQRQSAFGKKEAAAAPPPSEGVLKGRAIPADAPVRSIRTITEEENKVVIEGEVVGLDTRDLKSGRQLIAFGVCDLLRSEPGEFGDTLPVKLFRDPQKDPDYLAVLKNGTWVKVRGNVQLDKFSGELTMLADDVVVGKRPTREDTYEGPMKRVELHAHTTMSAMDALIDPAELVKTAVRWGHKAVAITDHGVVQAFPAASHVKVPDDFRVIYGCELFLVDDGTAVVQRPPKDVPLAGAEFVVLDIETTGFSPIGDDIIELGAVRCRGGEIVDSFQSFVRPTKPVPPEVQKLTNITPDMLEGAPEAAEALRAFFQFVGDAIVVAHNAQFDYSFLRYHRQKYLGEEFANPVLDTLTLARAVLPHMRSHSLAALTKELQVPLVDHHRADADAKTAAMVLMKLLERAEGVETVADLNRLTKGINVEQLRPYHTTVLVKTQAGMKNLYKLISLSHIEYFNRTPRVPRSELEKHREGLLVGSSTYGGQLFDALIRGVPDEELEQMASWYDYLEILPRDCLAFLLESGQVNSEEQLLSLNRRIYELGKKLGKPVCAVSDAHFLDPHQQVFRRILKHGIGFRDEYDRPFYLRTTQEMLDEFAYLGEQAAYEVVVENPNAIAAQIEKVKVVPDKLHPPVLEGSVEETRRLSWEKVKRVYGDPVPEKIAHRLEKELNAIIGNGFAVSYYISHLLVKKSMELGYLVGSRGSVGSSFVAWAMDITEVNALPPHYICPQCKYLEWHDDGKTGSGFDLPRKDCPRCGTPLDRDGQDIPFETFLGFKGDKVPDIDLNFSGEVQNRIQKYSEELLGGEKYVFKAGTVGTIAEKTAFGMVRAWLEESRITGVREAHIGYLAQGLAGVKRTTGQHPGGMVVCPVGMEIEEVTPVQYPADDRSSGVKTTHFDYHSFEQALMKLDILGHDDPTMLKMLQDLYREKKGDPDFDVRKVPVDDPQVLALFSPGGNRVLGIEDGKLQFDLGTIVLPEMGTRFVRQMLMETSPRNFSDLVRISGLSHGTDVWTNNAQELVKKGIPFQDVIGCRDDIMVQLIYWGVEPATAFKIMESVRKGKGLTPEMEETMRACNVPDWYIWSCKQIKYMFPKAHAAAYVLSCLRIAWFKVHEPLLFYAAYLSVRAGSVDANLLVAGPEAVRRYVQEIEAKGKDATPKEKDSLTEYELVEEAFLRGIRFNRVDLYRSEATRYLIDGENTLLCPFNALPGLGDSAAQAIVEARAQGPFHSKEDLKNRARLNKAVMELLEGHGCLEGLPEGNQLVFGF